MLKALSTLATKAALGVQEKVPFDVFSEKDLPGGVKEGLWKWNGYNIRYQRCGEEGPPVLLIHGFGGNCDHWRKNLPVLGLKCRAFAIDLLGYGYSDKPDPRELGVNKLYSFETWAQQALDFLDAAVAEPAFVICNSVGGIAGLQAAVQAPEKVKGVQLLDVSLRMLHTKKQQPWQRPLVSSFQRLLRETQLGQWFFSAVAKPQNVKSILQECYGDAEAVTDELVDFILKPGLQPGAVDVFLDFISYSGGPLPEELLPEISCPVSILWGELDPWEPIEKGRAYGNFDCVDEFVALPGVGHCPMDEAPNLVNPKILAFVERHSALKLVDA
ncbi:g11344 [Coccomyxa elongata]